MEKKKKEEKVASILAMSVSLSDSTNSMVSTRGVESAVNTCGVRTFAWVGNHSIDDEEEEEEDNGKDGGGGRGGGG